MEYNKLTRSQGIQLRGLSYLGASVAGVGDVNGDGIDDTVFSANYKIILLFGNKAGFDSVDFYRLYPSQGIVIGGFKAMNDYVVSKAGNMNGDGVNDILIIAFSENSSAGVVYVVF